MAIKNVRGNILCYIISQNYKFTFKIMLINGWISNLTHDRTRDNFIDICFLMSHLWERRICLNSDYYFVNLTYQSVLLRYSFIFVPFCA